MKNIIYYILSFHFLFGAIALPESNFDFLLQLPEMYHHCQATEDQDLNIVEFITNHLVHVDLFFAQLQDNDDKPHKPINYHFQQTNVLFATFSVHNIQQYYTQKVRLVYNPYDFYQSPYYSSVFHPPAFEI